MIRWSNLQTRCNDRISQVVYGHLSKEFQDKYKEFSTTKYGSLVFDEYTTMT